MATHFLTDVYQCSVCDSIIPTRECVENHGQDCRPPNNSRTKSWKYQQMTKTTFPCPRILLHKLPSNLSEKSLGKFLARGKPKFDPYSLWRDLLPTKDHEPFTEEEVRERIRYLGEKGGPLPRWYPRDRGIETEKRKLPIRTVRIPTEEEVKARKKKKSKEKPNYVGTLDSSDSDSEDETTEADKPFACPLQTCGIKLRDRSQLKSHFIMHLENNPWACPFPGCRVRLDSQPHFKRHIHWHIYPERKLACCKSCGQTYSTKKEMKEHTCFQQQPTPELFRRSVEKFVWVYVSLKKHYDDLKERELLLGESDERDMYFDFNYKVNMDAIIETDPVFIQVCEGNPSFWDQLFQDEDEPEPSTSAGRPRSLTTTTTGKRNPWTNPYTCPLSTCGIKLRSKTLLKSHFILHLENNPWACPVPGCNVKSSSRSHSRNHELWHEGIFECCKRCGYTYSNFKIVSNRITKKHDCFPQHPAPDLSKRRVKGGERKFSEYQRLHYENLRAKGLLLGNQGLLIIDSDDFQIDMDRVIEIDPVFIEVTKKNPEFKDDIIFGDNQSSTSSLDCERSRKKMMEANDYNLAKRLEGMETYLSTQRFGLPDEQLFDFVRTRTPYHFDIDSAIEDVGEIAPYSSNMPYACPLKKCKTGPIMDDKGQLKTHFILHLKNNPYACPVPECKARFNNLGDFQHHLEWHMGKHRVSPCKKCGQIFPTETKKKYHQCVRENPRSPDQDRENEEKLKREYDAAKCCVRGHYADLKAKGLFLEESPGHLLEFDFKFKIDIDRIIETDPVFLKVCQKRTGFYEQIFGDAQDQDPQPSTSRGMGGSSVQNIIATMDFSNITPNINDDNVPDSDIEGIGEIRTNYPQDNPFACPLKTCEVKLTNRSQLKSHFIIHLKNNPYACPIPGCRVRLDSQCKFKHHMERHLGQDQEKVDQAEFCLREHYADLQSRGLLLEESEEHVLKFDFKYKVDIDSIIKTDEVLLKVCMLDETFYDRLFGDEQPQPSTSTSTGGENQLEANLRMENGDNCNEGDASSIVETLKMVKNSVERETAPDEFTPHFEKHESGLTGESSPPEMNETVETESFTAEQSNDHDHGHVASKSDIYLKRLENGQFECTECRLSCKSEAGGKRHWLLKHNVKISSTKVLHSKVGHGSGPTKKMISNGENPHCSQSSRKRKSPNDINRDTNVKAVKVEPELDLGLTLIVPKKEEADCDCDVDLDIKPEIPMDQIKKEESEDFITGDVPPSYNVQVKTEPM